MIVTQLDKEVVREALRQVIDPELDCNIVDLGLIYSIRIEGTKVSVQMTLTTPACPMSESLAMGVQSAILNLDPVEEVEVDLVWDPPWDTDRISPEGRTQLGWGHR